MKKFFVLGSIIIQILFTQHKESEWRIESGITISHFQQQIKQAVGETRGQRLVNEFQIGVLVSGGYQIYEFFHIGIFTRVDRGERFLAHFNGFDAEGKTQTTGGIGGTYTEFWVGPLIRLQWKQLTFDLGFAPYGARKDNARNDIPNTSGATDGSFTLHPTIAWLLSLGGSFPVLEKIDALVKIEYRPRYYSKRGGDILVNDIEHGTQSIVPLIGVAYRL
ncbi:MAG: hypothetical protein HYV29_00760 [Ignavibacteriales bacterium]|nr:hypothetical protein [Ignavibacteriales bacterium]